LKTASKRRCLSIDEIERRAQNCCLKGSCHAHARVENIHSTSVGYAKPRNAVLRTYETHSIVSIPHLNTGGGRPPWLLYSSTTMPPCIRRHDPAMTISTFHETSSEMDDHPHMQLSRQLSLLRVGRRTCTVKLCNAQLSNIPEVRPELWCVRVRVGDFLVPRLYRAGPLFLMT
jgi:hypothetical protein